MASPYRDSRWYKAAGNSKDYIDWAFEAARAADPDAQLFLNDYNTELPGKRNRLLAIIKDLIDRGVPIDGVGHQHHLQMSSDVPEDVDKLEFKLIIERDGEIIVKDLVVDVDSDDNAQIIDDKEDTKFIAFKDQLNKEHDNWEEYGSNIINRL